MTIPPGPCPVPGCVPYILNVDKHLKGHKDLTQAQFERRRNRAKRDAAMAALERLRASNPQPAMVSRLDLQSEDPGEGPSQPRTCRRCWDLLKKNRDLEAQVTVLKARVRLYKRKPRPSSSTRPQQPQPQPPSSSSSSSSSSSPEEEEPIRPLLITSSPEEEEPTRPQQPQLQPQLQPQPTSSSSSEPTRPQQPQPAPEEPTRPQQPQLQPQPTSSSSSEPTRPQQPQPAPEEPTRPQQPQLQPQPTSSSSSEPTRPQQPQPAPEEPTRPQQPQPTSSSSSSEPTRPQQPQPAPEEPTRPQQLQPQPAPSSSEEEEPTRPLQPQPTSPSSEPTRPQQPQPQPTSSSDEEEPIRPLLITSSSEEEEDLLRRKIWRNRRRGRSRGSKLKDVLLGTSLDSYVQDYADFVFCPEGTQKMKENAVSKASRAKIFLKFLQLGWSSINYWTWEFLFNIPLIKIYPRILRKVGLAPTTVILYVGQAISFLEFFRSTPPKHSRVTGGQTTLVTRELRKLHRDLGRTVLGHQALVKQGKGLKLIAREDLARCQALARAKMPSLLEDIEKAAPRDPRTRYRFYGYLAAYLTSIYGHRTGVLTRMRVKEVKEAIGDDERGYLINVMEHKTVRKFGTAQLYLNAEEHAWFRTWLRLRSRAVPKNPYFFSSLGRGEAKDLVRYFRMAWAEMGLKGAPSFMDIRTAVSTYNFESNDKEVRHNLSSFMCHSASTQERFYALHKNLKRAKQIRDLFVCLALKDDKTAAPAAAPPAAAGPGEVEGDSKAEKPKKMTAAIKKIVKTVKVKVGLSPNIPIHPKVSQLDPKVSQLDPKVSQVDPKVSQVTPKYPKLLASPAEPAYPLSCPGTPAEVSWSWYTRGGFMVLGHPRRFRGPGYPQSIPIRSKASQVTPKYPNSLQSVPSYAKVSQFTPKYPKLHQSIPSRPKSCPQSIPIRSKASQVTPKYPNSLQSVPSYAKVSQFTPKYPKLHQSIPSRPKSYPQSIPIRSKASQVTPKYPNSPQGVPSQAKVSQFAPKYPGLPQSMPKRTKVPRSEGPETTESPPNGPLRSDDRFARQDRYGPPPEFPLASPCPGIVHHLSGPIARAHAPPPRRRAGGEGAPSRGARTRGANPPSAPERAQRALKSTAPGSGEVRAEGRCKARGRSREPPSPPSLSKPTQSRSRRTACGGNAPGGGRPAPGRGPARGSSRTSAAVPDPPS
ncbi:Proteoglycan 4 [Collichthys lucidus]|uniref:Proteoglycan 4 n=1 Tax=Collichthys lucidus TaxID=240159 RepID=A0A4U5TW88_COLLU|nr:Proteoglycan 4 [Collichthys lucidus]